MSRRTAADEEGRTLRADGLHVAEGASDADAAGDSGIVEPRETSPDHSGGGAVAAGARAAEPEPGALRRLARVDRRAEDGRAVDVGARVELELRGSGAPVRGESLQRLPP